MVSRLGVLHFYKHYISKNAFDGIVHLDIFCNIKQKNSHRVNSNFIYDQRESYYPDLFHYITARLLSEALVKKYLWFPNLVYFCLGSLIFLFVSLLLSESLNGTYSNIGIFIPVIVIAFLININNLDFNKNRSVYIGFQNGYYLSFVFLFM